MATNAAAYTHSLDHSHLSLPQATWCHHILMSHTPWHEVVSSYCSAHQFIFQFMWGQWDWWGTLGEEVVWLHQLHWGDREYIWVYYTSHTLTLWKAWSQYHVIGSNYSKWQQIWRNHMLRWHNMMSYNQYINQTRGPQLALISRHSHSCYWRQESDH